MSTKSAPNDLNRRALFGAVAVAGVANTFSSESAAQTVTSQDHDAHRLGGNDVVGEVDHARNGFDPHLMLTDWDAGDHVGNQRRTPTSRMDHHRHRPGV